MTCSFSKEFFSSAFTGVENAFISEYLPISSGDAVKVYLYGLFLCQNPNMDQSAKEMAEKLAMTEEKIIDCFFFWEEFGLVSVNSRDPLSVSYLPVRTSFSQKPRKIKAEKYADFSKQLQALIGSRMISTGEYTEYFNIMETYSIKPEAMYLIAKYCVDLKGEDINARYISKVAKDFGNRGLTTVDKVEKELSSYVLRTAELEKILKALSIKRRPDVEDSNLYKKWTSELGFEPKTILFVAKTLKRSTMQKLDEFLLHLFSTKRFSEEEISSYLKDKQAVYDLTIKINKALSIYVEVLDTEIDNYVNSWLSFGFMEDSLLFIATKCFLSGKNTLADMNEVILYLRERGFISLSSVNDYYESINKTDEFIKKLLLTAGVNRRPTTWDRENYSMWKNWNFSDEMILEAAKLSAGKSSPLAYINGVLSNWKNSSIFNLSDIQESSNDQNKSQEEYNLEYERRRSLAVSRAQKNTEKAMTVVDFADTYARLNSLEKDLAFAEIADNKDLLVSLEQEKIDLTNKAESLLKTVGLSLRELSPVYACKKCNDTGYVGTHRCDCFSKKV